MMNKEANTKTDAERAFEVWQAYQALTHSERYWFAHMIAGRATDWTELVGNLEVVADE
jgi:acetyl-CoA carboxylase alpha subunit